MPVVSLSKGIEQGTLLRMTEVDRSTCSPATTSTASAVLTGPNLAQEVAEGQPAASVIACADDGDRGELQQLCS